MYRPVISRNTTMKWYLLAVAALFAFAASASAEDKKVSGPITLKLIAKSDKYKFDGGGKTAEEYKKQLEELVEKSKKGERFQSPKPPAVDFVLQFTNTTTDDVTIHVGGDRNSYQFELTGGAGTVSLNSGLPFTADIKYPKAIVLAPGKSHEIPVKQFADGARGMSRFVYWTGPGDYRLSVKYTLSDAKGTNITTLTSEPVKITVTEK
jgi:hypothetical protein